MANHQKNTVMIVDDEIWALKHLAGLVDWDALHCSLVAQTDKAQEAVRLFRQKKPTIIITDISMPDMNGIDMMREILSFHIPVRFIFLTAYREFSYIQEALRLGASGFILKHDLDAELLQKELEKAARELRFELQRDALAPSEETPPPAAGKELIAVVEVDWPYPVVGPLQPPPLVMPLEQIRRMDFGGFQYIDYAQIIESRQNRCVLMMNIRAFYSQLAFLDELRRFFSQLQEIFSAVSDSSVSIASTATPFSAGQANEQREKLEALMDDRFFLGRNRVLLWENRIRFQPKEKVASEDIASFSAALRSGGAVRGLLQELFGEVMGSLPLFASLVRALTNELDRARQEADLPGLHEMLLAGALDTSLWYDFSGVVQWFEQECDRIGQALARRREAPSSKVRQGLELIAAHYPLEDISLEWVAEKLGISSVYLLKLLKKETGKTFTELLTQARMEAAAKLILEKRIKTRELALKVGYRSSQYFNTVFKKYYGCTPQDYRKHTGLPPTNGDTR